MRQITEAEFNAILESAERENDERVAVGLSPQEVTTNTYGCLGDFGELVEYHFGGSMFGFIQGGIHYSNGL